MLNFYDAACYIELADSIQISPEDQLRIDELFARAMDNIISCSRVLQRPFGRKFKNLNKYTDVETLLVCIPANWGVSIHRKPAQSGEGGKWTCQISMTSNPQDMASVGNTVAGRSIGMENAVIAALLRAGQHIEINKMTDPTPPNDIPPLLVA